MTAVANSLDRAATVRGDLRFLAFALTVVAGNALLIGNYPLWAVGPVPEWPVMVDLLLFVPLVYLALHWRRGKEAVFKTLALAGLGIFVGSLILPAESKHFWLVLEDLRFAALAVVLLVQLALIVLLIGAIARKRHVQNLEVTLDQSMRERFGDGVFARLMRLESRLWLYALCRRPIRHAFPGIRHFHVGQQGWNASNQAGFLVLIGAEIPFAHFLIYLFDPLIAAIVTSLSVYGFLFMLAEYRATLHRPLSVTERGLQVRYGVASDFLIDWASITMVDSTRGPVPKARGQMRLVGMGEANVSLQLAPGTRVSGLTGDRVIEQIFLGVDDPAGLIAEINHRRQKGC